MSLKVIDTAHATTHCNYVSKLYRFRDNNTCLARVTACDLEQYFNSIVKLKFTANINFLFVSKHIVANICYFTI